jgi:transposase
MARLITAAGHEVIVANSRELHVIFKSKKKTDRVDARTLAKLGQYDIELLHPVHHRSEQVQHDLGLLRARDMLVKSRTGLINFCRGIVKTMGERLPSCSADAFGKQIPPHVPEALREIVIPIVTQIAQLTTQILASDKQIATLLKTRYPDSRWVIQIKGVGPITTFAFMLLIENAARFSKSRLVGAYFGLVPRVADSGETKSQLRITKHGDTLMRRLLTTASQYILGPFGEDSDLRRHGQAIAARGGKNAKKRAVIAVARKLAVLMHRLLSRQEVYVPLFNAKRRAALAAAA